MRPTGAHLILAVLLAAPCRAVTETDLVLPSRVAEADRIAVRVAVPDTGRYGSQAPVVVHVPPGFDQGDPSRLGAPLAALGMIEIRFRFPDRVAGAGDLRGPGSAQVVAEVIAFAGGEMRATDGRSLAEVVHPLTPISRRLGLIGWSNGGNQAICALAGHDRLVQSVAWLATWETPLGDGAQTGLPGTWRSGPNPAWRGAEGRLDLTLLAWSAELPVPAAVGPPGPRGAFYLDLDRNGAVSEADVLPAALPVPGPGPTRFAYPTSLLTESALRGLPRQRPRHLLGAGEAAEFWSQRDGDGHFARVMLNRPELLVMVLGSARDHLSAAADHPHLRRAYDGWRAAGARFLRLNPDASYLAAVAGERGTAYFETPANLTIPAATLPALLVPEAVATDAQLVAAAAAELADRAHDGDLAADLERTRHPTSALPTFRLPAP